LGWERVRMGARAGPRAGCAVGGGRVCGAARTLMRA
jgi:hypothetical protein